MFSRLMATVGRHQLCNNRPLIHARYLSQKLGWPEGVKKSLEQERIEKQTSMPSLLMFASRKSFASYQMIQVRHFHAKGSKVKYLDFRHRLNTSNLRSHLLIIRRQKMKKHRRRKWRKKFKAILAKKRFKLEIAKEKVFRVELLTMIKRAENFDPKEYALRKIQEINSKPRELTREERLEELKELIRKNRFQTDYIKPKHRRLESSYVEVD